MIFGLGYQLENGLGINARYNLGFTDVFDFSRIRRIESKSSKLDTEVKDVYELKNRVFNVSLFYTF